MQVEPLRASPLNDDHVVGVLASQLRAAPSAAATPSVPEPTRGPWIEITSPHFILRTDEDVVLAHATMAELERSYAVLGAAVGTPRAVAATTPVEVVLFATRKEYEAFRALLVAGVLARSWVDDDRATSALDLRRHGPLDRRRR